MSIDSKRHSMWTILCRSIFPIMLLALPTSWASARELVVVGAQFPGVFESNEKGEFSGLGADLIRAIARQSGDTPRFKIYPWARAQMTVEQGLADILVGPYKTPEREQRFTFSEMPFYLDHMLFYCRGGETLDWKGDYARLGSKRIGHILGWAYGESFDKSRDRLQLIKVTDLSEGFAKLSSGHLDLLASNRRNTDGWLATQTTKPNIHPIEPIISVQPGYFAFPKKPKYESLKNAFDQFLRDVSSKGELAQMARKYSVLIPE